MRPLALDLQIFRLCLAAFLSVPELVAATPEADRTTVYRRVKVLLQEGLLEPSGDQKRGIRVRTTEAGRRELTEHELQAGFDALDRLYPPLRRMPTPVHRASLELALFAVYSRRHLDRHLPTLIWEGPPLTGKTWLAESLCLMLGLDPTRHILQLGAEGGRGLFVRRDAGGNLAYKREVLDSPLVVLEELQHAEEKVRKTIIGVLMRGLRKVAVENIEVDVPAVPVITLNPKESDTLGGTIGITEAEIRRSVITNFAKVQLPDWFRTGGEEVLQEVRNQGPIPQGGPLQDCSAHRQRVADFVQKHATEPRLINVDLLLGLAYGATAYFPPEQAVRHILHRYFTVIETIGWTKPGWHEALLTLGQDRGPAAPREGSPKTDPFGVELKPLLRESKLAEIEEDLQDVDPGAARDLVRLSARWHKERGGSAREFVAHLNAGTDLVETKRGLEGDVATLAQKKADDAGRLQVIQADIRSLGTTSARVRRLHVLAQRVEKMGFTDDQLERHIEACERLQALGYTIESLERLEEGLREKRLKVDDIPPLIRRGQSLQTSIRGLEQRVEAVQQDLSRLQAENTAACRCRWEWWMETQGLMAQYNSLLQEVRKAANLREDAISVAEVRRRVEGERGHLQRCSDLISAALKAQSEALRIQFDALRRLVKLRQVSLRCPRCGETLQAKLDDFIEGFRSPKEGQPMLPEGKP